MPWFTLYWDSKTEDDIWIKISDFYLGNTNQSPFQSRFTNSSYSIDLFGTLEIKSSDSESQFIKLFLGQIPLMVLSSKCVLKQQAEVSKLNEDFYEIGGFFIVNGLEKLLRNLIVPKKNYPIGVIRQTFT